MNAVQNPIPLAGESRDSALSALVDGELSAEDLKALLVSLDDAGEGQQTWNTYHVIGDVLRGSVPARAQRSPQRFLAGIHAQLNVAAVEVASTASAAGVGADASQNRSEPVERLHALAAEQRGDAANEAVFRWKLVAGLASFAAVVAVSTSMLRMVPGSPGGDGASPQLAQVSAPTRDAHVGPDASSAVSQSVVVNTPQGPVLRDPQLEALMAQHRQYGDMSALQMPSGFLRNATYDAPAR